jgi:diguanylate cyclase (GGDEF)-like protein
MKQNKKVIVMIIVGVVILLASLLGYYILNREDKDTTLTLLEKQWIESNKNKVVDFNILNNIAVLGNGGEGVVFDFLKSLEETTGISFNKTPYTSITNLKAEYAFKEVKNKDAKDLLVYQDHYVLVVKDNIKYHSASDIKDLVIGVLDDDLSNANKYLKNAVGVSFKAYGTSEALIASFEEETTALVIPRLKYLELLMSNPDYNIAYSVIEMTNDYVITLGENNTLNNIFKKYFTKWMNDNLDKTFNKHFSNSYFTFNEIDNKEKVRFRSKRYAYGFLDNVPYDSLETASFEGINNNILIGFARLADVEISYKQYNSIGALTKDFNSNNIDLMYELNANTKYEMDVVNTIAAYDSKSVIAVPLNTNIRINSLSTLENKEVLVIKDSKISQHLKSFDIKVKEFNNLKDLFNKKDKNDLIAIDYYSYQYYVRNELKDYYIGHSFNLTSNKNFVLRDIQANDLFNMYFKFYLTYMNEQETLSNSYNELLTKDQNRSLYQQVFNIGGYILFVFVLGFEGYKIINKRSKKEPVLTKSDKLKYVDMMTSLKNRNYLNDSIERWDASDVYPQAIVVADLNNIAYINDNYGYQEGDKVIREAANILINNQIENSDIIRTSGNEFLVYLVGHEEKQVVAYMRRLNKEFRELSHDFGAALGYSIIDDGIKTIDDAINEATLDMRTNKEALAEE